MPPFFGFMHYLYSVSTRIPIRCNGARLSGDSANVSSVGDLPLVRLFPAQLLLPLATHSVNPGQSPINIAVPNHRFAFASGKFEKEPPAYTPTSKHRWVPNVPAELFIRPDLLR